MYLNYKLRYREELTMKHIPENIQLLGLIVTTKPFEYSENIVTSNFSAYIEKADLIKVKEELEKFLTHETFSDEDKIYISDEIYFIDKIIEKLGI
jgi:uncharacterized protein YchJ